MTTLKVIGAVVGIVAVVAGITGYAFLVVSIHDKADRDERFAGACQIMGGNVHDDVCIKDGEVVLKRNEIE